MSIQNLVGENVNKQRPVLGSEKGTSLKFFSKNVFENIVINFIVPTNNQRRHPQLWKMLFRNLKRRKSKLAGNLFRKYVAQNQNP